MHAQIDSEQIVEIESSRIALEVPDDGLTTQEGWKILPLCPPVVSKFYLPIYSTRLCAC